MNIYYSKQAQRFLSKQTLSVQRRIVNAIEALPAGDVKKLQGRSDYRLRIGDYRVIFGRDGYIIYIKMIDNRGQVYKRR